jgi:hypothetical protein
MAAVAANSTSIAAAAKSSMTVKVFPGAEAAAACTIEIAVDPLKSVSAIARTAGSTRGSRPAPASCAKSTITSR